MTANQRRARQRTSLYASLLQPLASKAPWLLVALLTACASRIPNQDQRLATAQTMATAAGWTQTVLHTESFDLTAWAPASPQQADLLTVYIEGDGLAWISSKTPSLDPTPITPRALSLAVQHGPAAAAYLARPCQYQRAQHDAHCRSKYWTSHRFSPEIIQATQSAVDQLKRRFNARQVQLIGYSGGGAVAALVAASRQDVVRLITVAGNLDTQAWAKELRISPLTGSLNPADQWKELLSVPQVHFVGGRDRIVRRNTAESYAARFPDARRPDIRVLEQFGHVCCWAEQWPSLLGGLEPLPAIQHQP